MSADVLSDVLRTVRLSGAVYFEFNVSPPWAFEAPASREIAAKVMPGAQRVIEYHLIARGSGWGNIAGQSPIRLQEGDLLVFPQGDAHVLRSALELPPILDMSIYTPPFTDLPLVYDRAAGEGEQSRILCCFLGCDETPFNPLLTSLPRVMHLPGSGDQARSGWLGTLLHIANSESGRPRAGGENVLARLSELVFVEAIRRYLETLPADQTGWLAGLRDPMVGRALTALHQDAGRPWTVEGLARVAGLSRSVFAQRFTGIVGHPPMQYLALWRMQLAARLLADGSGVAAVAEAVGYESEAAFSRTFKKLVGKAPGTWRRESNLQQEGRSG
ncbi:MAG: AraC family transcriptional regulator [Bryobacteraceae bacterium]